MRHFYLLLLVINISVTFGSVCLFGLIGLVILGTISTTDLSTSDRRTGRNHHQVFVFLQVFGVGSII